MKIIIIGAGFGGLGAACLLSQAGHQVTVFEKNDQPGGRAGSFEEQGFRFDTGPSWYLMPDVFERFFRELGENIEDHFNLTKLRPGYRVFFKGLGRQLDIHSDLARDKQAFEAIETGASLALEQYLQHTGVLYETAISNFIYKNYASVKSSLTPSLLRQALKLNMLSNAHDLTKKYFSNPQLQQIIEYPYVFLGSSPYRAPTLYHLLNHALFNQGVYYPHGGIYEVVKALVTISKKHGTQIKIKSPVEQIIVEGGKAVGVMANKQRYSADLIISNADLYYTEKALLGPPWRDHSEKYWQSRTLAPSALLMYLGVNRQYDSLSHHNLVFSQDWRQNFKELSDSSGWPSDPSFYVCAPGKTDPTVAPPGKENLFVLVPIAAGLQYTEGELENYTSKVLKTMETEMDLPRLRKNIIYKKLFAVKDFESHFNSFQGTGLGLAHTLQQSAIFRPGNKSKKVNNLYYVGANVHPGIGLPATLISAQLVAQRIGEFTPSGKRGRQSDK